MDAQIRTDAVAGAVVIVMARHPQRQPRQGVQLVPRCPGRETHHGQGDMALEHEGEHAALVGRRLAHGHRPRHIGGAVQILAAAVDQQQTALLHPADRPRHRLVVRQGAVGPGAGDGVEAQIFQRPGRLAEPLQRLGHLTLIREDLLPHGVDPVQEAGQGRAVANVRLPRPLDLDRILAGPRQGAGIHAAHHGRAGRFQPVEIPGRRLARIDQHLLTRQTVQSRVQRGRRFQRHRVAQPAGQFIGHLAGIEEQLRRPVRLHHRLAERQGRADHVAATDIEQPGQRRRRRQDGRVRSRLGNGFADAGAFRCAALAAVPVFVGNHRRGRLLGTFLGPGQIQRIGFDRLQLDPGLLRRTLQRRKGVGTVQPWVIADDRPLRRPLQPGRHPALDQIQNLELRRVHLGPNLHRIAAVREHGGPVHQHRARAGRTGEAGQPGQPVVGGGQVLVLMLILVRDQQAVEPLLGHFRADTGQMFRPEGRIGGFIEGLAHGGGIAFSLPSWGGWLSR